MRRFLIVAAVAGCAQGGSPLVTGDGSVAQSDAPPAQVDAPRTDGPLIDAAPPIDAPMIDAAPPIDAPPDACVPMVTELVLNGNFDTAPIGTGWTEIRYDPTLALVVAGTASFPGQSAPNFALLGDYTGVPAEDFLYRDFVVPPMTSALQLTGYVAVATLDSTTIPYDQGLLGFLFPAAPATPPIIVLDVDNTDAPALGSWTSFLYNFTQNMSGQTLRLQMESSNDVSLPSAFVFDTLSVRATHGCP